MSSVERARRRGEAIRDTIGAGVFVASLLVTLFLLAVASPPPT